VRKFKIFYFILEEKNPICSSINFSDIKNKYNNLFKVKLRHNIAEKTTVDSMQLFLVLKLKRKSISPFLFHPLKVLKMTIFRLKLVYSQTKIHDSRHNGADFIKYFYVAGALVLTVSSHDHSQRQRSVYSHF